MNELREKLFSWIRAAKLRGAWPSHDFEGETPQCVKEWRRLMSIDLQRLRAATEAAKEKESQ
jgi:hypothetical protein